MSTSIREQIFQNIKTTIEGITTSGGYNYTVSDVLIIHGKRDDSAYSEPLIYIYPSSEVVNMEMAEKGYDFYELTIGVEAWIRGDKSDMNTNVNKILADMVKALGMDPTRGGLAIDTKFVSNEFFLVDLSSDKAGIFLEVKIDYQIKYGRPDEQ